MATAIQLMVCLVLASKAVIGFKYSGTYFVASCPWLKYTAICEAYISTSETLVKVTISEINRNKITKTQNIFVGRKNPAKFLLDKDDDKYKQPLTKYPVRVFKSDEPIRIIVIQYVEEVKYLKTDAIVLSPKTNCYYSYYTMTARTSPFFTIFSFDYPRTEIKVKFPKYKPPQKYFNLNCFASENCAPEKTVIVRMLKHEAWYFTLQDEWAYLMNVLITSNNPVFVVSGNVYGSSGHDAVGTAIATTSLKSSKTWGKTYIVYSFEDLLKFGISTIVFPLTYKVHVKQDIQSFVLESTQIENLEYNTTADTIAFTADIPFGLYQIFSSGVFIQHDLRDVSILNLIPVEQWLPGTLLVNYDFPVNFKSTHYLITQASRKDVKFSSPADKKNGFLWHSSKISIKGKLYSVAELKAENPDGSLLEGRLLVRTGRVMVYVTLTHISIPAITFGTHPYDFHQGTIYQKNCSASKPLCTDDGIDNDCDGYVDEEKDDGVDDDGDGLIDEDNMKPYSDGDWSQWTFACNQLCNDMKLSVRVRTCSGRSPYGRECEGESIQCDEQTCPKNCVISNISNPITSTRCFCEAGCASCERNIFECVSCKAGYRNTEYCLEQNPEGGTDAECSIYDETKVSKMTEINKSNKKEEINKVKKNLLFLSPFLGCFFIGAVVIHCKRSDNNAGEDSDKDEVVAMEMTAVANEMTAVATEMEAVTKEEDNSKIPEMTESPPIALSSV